MAPLDHDLIAVASQALARIPPNDDLHTVAAAVRARSGAAFTGANVFHFTGGPCAELVALGAAAAAGVLAPDLSTVVAVSCHAGRVRVLSPCGRCRQALLDYNPRIAVIVPDADGKEMQVPVSNLLPFAYVYDGDPAARPNP